MFYISQLVMDQVMIPTTVINQLHLAGELNFIYHLINWLFYICNGVVKYINFIVFVIDCLVDFKLIQQNLCSVVTYRPYDGGYSSGYGDAPSYRPPAPQRGVVSLALPRFYNSV